MSMLAEPRRRQKWSLNPRGAEWANDDNKFGQKLMEKMGWSKGKGLGREEQGMKEHISLKFKDNSKGLGYSGKDDEWIKNYEGFEDVLSTLNNEHNSAANSKNGSLCNSPGNSDEEIDQKNKKSLEARSKVSKARVHYHKFTRGKDLSRYNADDIACILGSKRAKMLAEAKTNDESTTEIDEVGHVDKSNGVTTIKGCSVQDYFAQKMDAFKKNLERKTQKVEADNCTGEAESTVRHGFGFDSNIEENTATAVVDYDEKSTQSSTKKMKSQCEELLRNKQNKKEKKIIQLEENENLENRKGMDTYNLVVENKDGKRKKKKKQIKDREDHLNQELGENHQSNDILSAEVSKKSKKKKRVTDIDESIDSKSVAFDIHELQLKKKKKKSKSSEETVNGDGAVVEEIEQYTSHTKKKKRKRNKEELEPAAKDIDILEIQKKTKVRKDKHLDQCDIRGNDADGMLCDMQLKKKKKKQK